MSYPASLVSTDEGDVSVGSVAKSAGKTLNCQGHSADAGAYVYRCILSGGRSRIQSGPVAMIEFHLRPPAPSGPVTVRVTDAISALPDGQSLKIAPTQLTVELQ